MIFNVPLLVGWASVDRDLNAALNLEDWAVNHLNKDAGRAPELLNARGGLVRRASGVLTPGGNARPGEARTRVVNGRMPLTVTPGADDRKGVMQAS